MAVEDMVLNCDASDSTLSTPSTVRLSASRDVSAIQHMRRTVLYKFHSELTGLRLNGLLLISKQ